MKPVISYIQQHLSLRLGLLIMLVVASVSCALLGVLFYPSKQLVRTAAFNDAIETLGNTVNSITDIMDSTETATMAMEQNVHLHLDPDSLLAYTRQMLEQHPYISGFTIAMKPYYFPQYGRSFSAYSLRQGDSIVTVLEKHNYFVQVWYKEPWEKNSPLWLEPYIDSGPGVLSSSEYNFSFTKPIYNEHGERIGVICTDLLLKWLSLTVSAVKPYPNSSAIMLGHDGRYIVHPDTAKLVRESIFSDPDPRAREDIGPLGRDMLAGHTGMQQLVVDGHDAHLFYRPLERTGWCIAIVCPDSDVFSRYDRMIYTIGVLNTVFLLLLLLFCYLIIHRAIIPINKLAAMARRISDGHFDKKLPRSQRVDTVGQLQNSFVRMQETLDDHVTQLKQMNEALEQQNKELQRAYQVEQEADQRKTAFIRDMTHQIRTPLNIINGFTQVMAMNYQELPAEEIGDITARMKSSAKAISRISRMLSASAANRKQVTGQTTFGCNDLCLEAVAAVENQKPPTVTIGIDSAVDDDFTICSDRKLLLAILVELLDNAQRFAPEGTITLGCQAGNANTVVFTVTDTGAGIAPDDRNRIFSQFTKLDSFSEGMGLGLSLCRHTAHLLGGDLTIDDSYTSGTRFVITLPSLAA